MKIFVFNVKLYTHHSLLFFVLMYISCPKWGTDLVDVSVTIIFDGSSALTFFILMKLWLSDP